MNIFFKKNKKKESSKKEVKKKERSEEKEERLTKKDKIEETSGIAWKVLKKPHITEKATNLLEANQYVFEVYPDANKTEIKKAIEGLYKVNVLSVKIINIPKKRRRLGRISGWRKGYKKAIVRIKEGQKIEILPR